MNRKDRKTVADFKAVLKLGCSRCVVHLEVIKELVEALKFRLRCYEGLPPGAMSKGEYITIQQMVAKAEEFLK